MKNKKQPTRTSFSRNFQCKKTPRWLSKLLHFGIDNQEKQLRDHPVCIDKIERPINLAEDLGLVLAVFPLFLFWKDPINDNLHLQIPLLTTSDLIALDRFLQCVIARYVCPLKVRYLWSGPVSVHCTGWMSHSLHSKHQTQTISIASCWGI